MSSMLSLQEKINAREEAEAAMKAKSAANMQKMNEFMHKMAMVFGPILETVFDEIFKLVFPLVEKTGDMGKKIVDMTGPTQKIKDFFKSLKETFIEMKPYLMEFFHGLKNIATTVGPVILTIFKGVFKVVSYLVSSIGKFFNLFKKGNKDLNVTKSLIGGAVTGVLALVAAYKVYNGLVKIGRTELGKKLKDYLVEKKLLIFNNGQVKAGNALQKAGNVIKMYTVGLLNKEGRAIAANNIKTKAGNALENVGNLIKSAGNKLRALGNILTGKGNTIAKKGILTTLKDLMGNIFSMAFKAGKAVAGIPIVGPILAAAAVGAAIAGGMVLYNKFKSQPGDDVMSEGGYGKRTLFGPEGAIRLNDRDTVIAGTDLFGKSKSSASSTPSNDNSALVAEMQAIKSVLQAILSKEGGVFIDGTKVGSTLALTSYKTQ
jgi:hypothetical protein